MDRPALARDVAGLREIVARWRNEGARVALVPTMGALHAGHISLIERARAEADRVVVSIFVNPTQFAPSEDFSKYPRTFQADLDKLRAVAADLCFAPDVAGMYPSGFGTTILVDGVAKADLEDHFRPTHFTGVATVVAKLLIQAQADVAIFGEKDYQQLLVVKRMATDLDIPTRIIGAPTLREADGLAMSSRNVYLSAGDRASATALYRALREAAGRIIAGDRIGDAMRAATETVVGAGFEIDYLEARHAETLARIADRSERPIRLLAAARLGATRLIDNIAVE
ncbi:MAG: pantoate--beta-alanine ligase [Methylobacteriaceae bacterium]|nr:pantoate--beta-alanine ligase [Methylobacteriaceae bacterium]